MFYTLHLEIIIEFIWNRVLDVLINEIFQLIFNNLKKYGEYILSKNRFINKYFIKYKIGQKKYISTYNISNLKKSNISHEYIIITQFLLHNKNKYNVESLNVKKNNTDVKFQIIKETEFMLNENLIVNIQNNIDNYNKKIISTMEICSYTKNNFEIEQSIEKLLNNIEN